MPKFYYQARTENKELKEGVIEAESQAQVLARLSELAYFPLTIEEVKESLHPVTSFFRKRGKPSSYELSNFTRQLANLVGAGLTIIASLEIIKKENPSNLWKRIIEEIIADLRDGRMFSESLLRHPQFFSSLYVNLVKAGEIGGFLEKSLEQLANFLEQEEELKAGLKMAMIYPLLISLASLGAIIILLTIVIPKIAIIFEDFQESLPLPTRFILNLSESFQRYWWTILLGVFLGVVSVKRIRKTKEGRLFLDRLRLKIPLLGELVFKRELERFSRVLATLSRNGIPILASLEVVGDVLENEILRQELEGLSGEIREGLSLTQAIRKCSFFPPDVVSMVAVGEESGTLERVLQKVASSYAKEVARLEKKILSFIEPLIIFVMAIIVFLIVLAMLLPIFQMNFMLG